MHSQCLQCVFSKYVLKDKRSVLVLLRDISLQWLMGNVSSMLNLVFKSFFSYVLANCCVNIISPCSLTSLLYVIAYSRIKFDKNSIITIEVKFSGILPG